MVVCPPKILTATVKFSLSHCQIDRYFLKNIKRYPSLGAADNRPSIPSYLRSCVAEDCDIMCATTTGLKFASNAEQFHWMLIEMRFETIGPAKGQWEDPVRPIIPRTSAGKPKTAEQPSDQEA